MSKPPKGQKPDPEYIAMMRQKREEERQLKRQALLDAGIDPDVPADLRFIKRPMLAVPSQNDTLATRDVRKLKVLTYNMLAQALIRRKLFPTSGNAVKWFKRSQVLLSEIKHYDADIMCLQEVDVVQYDTFWKDQFKELGYDSQFHNAEGKNHGICIAYRNYKCIDRVELDYDKMECQLAPCTVTRNVGLLCCLEDKTGGKLLIGTTHLFWHPFGTWERTRQCYLLVRAMSEFQSKWPGALALLGGDFNSQPFDTPYLSITSKPIVYTDRAYNVIGVSTSFKYSKKRETGEEEEGGNIEKSPDQPQNTIPEDPYVCTPEQQELVDSMQKMHNELPHRAISFYSAGYRTVHPENSGLDNDKGEPEQSNWAHTWRGLLDYIMCVVPWNGEDTTSIDTLDDLPVKVTGFLRMPPASEMSTHGQPHEGEYPSDHLCMMVELELPISTKCELSEMLEKAL